MKGNNELILNQVTLVEAMQEYLDKRMGDHAPKVVFVSGMETNGGILEFRVKVTDRLPTGPTVPARSAGRDAHLQP